MASFEMGNLPCQLRAKILRLLTLQDLINTRNISPGWRSYVDHLGITALCFSELKREQIFEKRRLTGGKFNHTFISSSKFESFFSDFGKSVLRHLKHLRICTLTLEDSSSLAKAINSLGKLNELDLFDLSLGRISDSQLELPNLVSISIENLNGIGRLILCTPKLQKIKLWNCGSFRLEVVHTESVESISSTSSEYLDMEKFKNLKHLCCLAFHRLSNTFLENLENLETVQIYNRNLASQLHVQKQRNDFKGLKLYYYGILFDSHEKLQSYPREPRIEDLIEENEKLADQILGYATLDYSKFVGRSGMETRFWKKFVCLREIRVDHPIRIYTYWHQEKNKFCEDLNHVRWFLELLKSLDNIVGLHFETSQLQELLGQLPDHCPTVEKLTLREAKDLKFLFRFKELTDISLRNQIDADFLRRVFKELEFVVSLRFFTQSSPVEIKRDQSKRFTIIANGSQTVFRSLGKRAIKLLNLREAPKESTKEA